MDQLDKIPIESSKAFYLVVVIFFACMLYAYVQLNSSSRTSSKSGEQTTGLYKLSKTLSGYRHTQRCEIIQDEFKSYPQVQNALRQNGLEYSKVIIGVDYTKSNTWNGKRSFNGLCLHARKDKYGNALPSNPYRDVLSSIGTALAPFNDDNTWAVYGFGDIITADHSVFPFTPGRECNSVKEVLDEYDKATESVRMSGPTSFLPIINKAIEQVIETGKFHILIIIADGEIVDEVGTEEAIIRASKYPLSIIVVGVGDGPWDTMESYDDGLGERDFDNFQFVNYNKVKNRRYETKQNFFYTFAMHCLMEVPKQFRYIKENGLLAKVRSAKKHQQQQQSMRAYPVVAPM